MDKAEFQFNFFNKPGTLSCNTEASNSVNTENDLGAKEWIVSEELLERLRRGEGIESELVDDSIDLLKRKFSSVLKETSELSKITEISDIIPNKYEGGLKTWECSIDLLHYLKEDQLLISQNCNNVFEIGCGSGLPGIFCYKQQQQGNQNLRNLNFVFQDFNQTVLESVTLPNILLNVPESDLKDVKFLYGDWNGLLNDKLTKHSFDLILTSETIYRAESYEILLKIFDFSLKMTPEARVLLAAKDYYFGLGGSVNQFINVAKSKGSWSIEVLKHFSEGVPRSIIQLKRHHQNGHQPT